MSNELSSRKIISNDDIIKILDIDRFRPSLKCDLFIPSYIHSLSIATEYVYNYVLSRFPKDYFESIHVVGKHPYDDFRRFDKGNLAKRENPSLALGYTIQYDFNDNFIDDNLLSINKYLKKSQWERSFFKCPHHGIYVGMDFETMLINYNFRIRVNTRAEQLDLYNRMRKIFRIGCTETNDIDCDFHLDKDLILALAKEAKFNIDESTKDVLDPWNFVSFLNSYSQMPILYKLRLMNQKYEYFLRIRNIPVHLDFQNQIDVDDGSNTGMVTSDFTLELQIEMRFPAPRTFAMYNEGHWIHGIHTEKDDGIKLYSMKVIDIPEENYKGWPLYGHSDYMADDKNDIVKEIDIRELFKAPVNIKVNTDLDSIIEDSIKQHISPDAFIEMAVFTKDIAIYGSGRIPITMDWENRKIILPQGMINAYLYIAIYIDREYVNSKVIEKTDALNNRIVTSEIKNSPFANISENEVRKLYEQEHLIEKEKSKTTNLPKQRNKARFIVNKK